MSDHDGNEDHDEHERHEHHSGHGHHEHDSHEHDSHEHGGHTHDEHHAHDVPTLGAGIVTISTSRTQEEDPSGDAIAGLFEDAGHEIAVRKLVDDNYDEIQGTVDSLADRDDVDVIVTTGGTGITPDDVTPEAVHPLFDKDLPGFGELFRRLSYEEIGTMVVGTRALAGIVDETPVFCLPGSENAVRLGVGEIVLEEAGHLTGLARRD